MLLELSRSVGHVTVSRSGQGQKSVEIKKIKHKVEKDKAVTT